MGIESKNETIGTKEAIRQKIKAELESFHIAEVPTEILEHFVVLEENSHFNDDSRMINEGVRSVLDFEKSFQLKTIEKMRLCLAAYIHDIGKAGPLIDPDCGLAVVKLFSVENVKDREKTTIGEIIKTSFPDEASFMISNLAKAGVTPDVTMFDFYDKHAFWTQAVLDRYPEVFDKQTRIIAASHHLDKNNSKGEKIDPYKIHIENVVKVSNELKFSIFLLMAMDKYQAQIRRGGATHKEAMDYLRKDLRLYEGDEMISLIIKTIDQLGATNSLFSESIRSQKNQPKSKQSNIIN